MPVEMVVLMPRKLCMIAVCPAAALITVFEKSIGLAYVGPTSSARRSNCEIVCTLQNIVPSTKPTSSSFLIDSDQPLLFSASCAAEVTSRDVRSSGRRFLRLRYFCASNEGISPPSGQPRPAVLKSSTGLTAPWPEHRANCKLAGESPSEEITPAPVITTLFLISSETHTF